MHVGVALDDGDVAQIARHGTNPLPAVDRVLVTEAVCIAGVGAGAITSDGVAPCNEDCPASITHAPGERSRYPRGPALRSACRGPRAGHATSVNGCTVRCKGSPDRARRSGQGSKLIWRNTRCAASRQRWTVSMVNSVGMCSSTSLCRTRSRAGSCHGSLSSPTRRTLD